MGRIPRSQARNTHFCNRAWSQSMGRHRGRRLDVAVGRPVLPTRRSRAGSLIELGWGRLPIRCTNAAYYIDPGPRSVRRNVTVVDRALVGSSR